MMDGNEGYFKRSLSTGQMLFDDADADDKDTNVIDIQNGNQSINPDEMPEDCSLSSQHEFFLVGSYHRKTPIKSATGQNNSKSAKGIRQKRFSQWKAEKERRHEGRVKAA
jgi:hypothetical protein